MPPYEPAAQYLIDFLFDIGPTTPVGMGEGPISEVEIAAWQSNRRVRLTGWECEVIRHLSRIYCGARAESKERNAPAPWVGPAELDAQNRERVAQGFREWANKMSAVK